MQYNPQYIRSACAFLLFNLCKLQRNYFVLLQRCFHNTIGCESPTVSLLHVLSRQECGTRAPRTNMTDVNYGLFTLLSAISGIAAHLGYFIHGEHHMQSLQWLLTIMFSPLVLSITILKFDITSSYIVALNLTAIILTSFFASLTASILIYRIFFHPLRNFPGPLAAKCSKLTHVMRLLGTSDNYLQAHALHEKYGNVVR